MNARQAESYTPENTRQAWKKNVRHECLNNWSRDSRMTLEARVVATQFLEKVLETPQYSKSKSISLPRAIRKLIRSFFESCALSSTEHGVMVSEIVESLARNGQLRLALALFRAHNVTRRSENVYRNAFRQAAVSIFAPILYLTSLLTLHTYLVSWVLPRLRTCWKGERP
jgi:hypothetical protein